MGALTKPGSATARAGVNIALVKYWGKRDIEANLPAVGSISLTLDGVDTVTHVRFDHQLTADRFVLNGTLRDDPRVTSLLNEVRTVAQSETFAEVSTNSVPTASGLASSASGFSALGLASWLQPGCLRQSLNEMTNSSVSSVEGLAQPHDLCSVVWWSSTETADT